MKLLAWLKTFIAAFCLLFSSQSEPAQFCFLSCSPKFIWLFLFCQKDWLEPTGRQFFSFLLSRKTVHIFLGILVVIVCVSGIMSQQTNAKSLFDNADKTLISGLIISNDGSSDDSALIEETASAVVPPADTQYLNNGEVAINQPQFPQQPRQMRTQPWQIWDHRMTVCWSNGSGNDNQG